METRFTPWRMNYIKGTDKVDNEGCVLCNLHQSPPTDDPDNLLLYRGRMCYVVMNLYPYNTGHLMVVPYAHIANLVELDNQCAEELFALTRRCVANLQAEYQSHGFNLGMNLGRVAGAGIADHLHMHIVPRWEGDTNFMPLIGGTKLVPEELPRTYARLRPHFEKDEQ